MTLLLADYQHSGILWSICAIALTICCVPILMEILNVNDDE
jgi:hypothetical protein